MQIKNQLTVFRDLLQLVEESINIVKRHPKFFFVLFILLLCYYGLRYHTYDKPKSVIQRYYFSINAKEYNKAWYQLNKEYRKTLHDNDI